MNARVKLLKWEILSRRAMMRVLEERRPSMPEGSARRLVDRVLLRVYRRNRRAENQLLAIGETVPREQEANRT